MPARRETAPNQLALPLSADERRRGLSGDASSPRRAPQPRVLRLPAPVRPAPGDEAAGRLTRALRSLIGTAIDLRVHDNRSTMVSFRQDPGRLHLRVHHMFLDAPPEVLRALADYARTRAADAGRVLDQYVLANRDRIRPADPRESAGRPLRAQGQVHDLQAIFDELNRRYFRGTVQARIGWGRGSTRRRRRTIRLGAYFHDTQTILMHPAMDRPEVPRFFVELVVYHEMLHQAVPQPLGASGRRCVHSPEFRARERLFHDYERARDWEDRHLGLLLRPTSSSVPGRSRA